MVLRTVIDTNVKWSRATERRLGLQTDKTLWRHFEQEADALLRALPDGAVVLDLGGGRRCVYAGSVQPPGRLTLIAVDVSAEELALNSDVTETRVADVAEGLPMPTASVDLVLSRALLEHVENVPDRHRAHGAGPQARRHSAASDPVPVLPVRDDRQVAALRAAPQADARRHAVDARARRVLGAL